MNNTRVIAIISVLGLLLIAGICIPIDSYITRGGCSGANRIEVRHNLIFGGSLEQIRQSDNKVIPEHMQILCTPTVYEHKLYAL